MNPSPESPSPFRPVAPAWHTWLFLIYRVVAAWLLLFRFSSRQSPHPHSHVVLYVSLILGQFLMLGYVAWGVQLQGGSLQTLIGGRWSTFREFLRDCRTAAGFWIACVLILAGIGHLLKLPSPVRSLGGLAPQRGNELLLWLVVAASAGICEEIAYRGYLQRQFAAWSSNAPIGILLSAALFGVGHIYQGGKRAILLGVFGLLFGYLAEKRKTLLPGILAHTWQDCLAGALLFLLRAKF